MLSIGNGAIFIAKHVLKNITGQILTWKLAKFDSQQTDMVQGGL